MYVCAGTPGSIHRHCKETPDIRFRYNDTDPLWLCSCVEVQFNVSKSIKTKKDKRGWKVENVYSLIKFTSWLRINKKSTHSVEGEWIRVELKHLQHKHTHTYNCAQSVLFLTHTHTNTHTHTPFKLSLVFVSGYMLPEQPCDEAAVCSSAALPPRVQSAKEPWSVSESVRKPPQCNHSELSCSVRLRPDLPTPTEPGTHTHAHKERSLLERSLLTATWHLCSTTHLLHPAVDHWWTFTLLLELTHQTVDNNHYSL